MSAGANETFGENLQRNKGWVKAEIPLQVLSTGQDFFLFWGREGKEVNLNRVAELSGFIWVQNCSHLSWPMVADKLSSCEKRENKSGPQ